MKRVLCAALALFLLCASLPGALALSDGAVVPDSDAPTAVPTAEPVEAGLRIDSGNLYAYMTRCYEEGYVPTVAYGSAIVVLPLLCGTPLLNDELTARADLGDPSTCPFEVKNYEMTVPLLNNPVNGGTETVRGYCVTLFLQLKPEYYNGSYPVTVRVSGKDLRGNPVEGDFPVYVQVTDGKDPNATPEPSPVPAEEPVVLSPKVLVQSTSVLGSADGTVEAGTRAKVAVTLKNTSETESLENMAVTAGSPGEGFVLASASDSVYVGALEALGTVELTWEYDVRPETPAGQYTVPISFDFAYGKGMTASGSGTARFRVTQPLSVEFALLQMPAEAVVSDTVEVTVQAVNLSHADAYNVRASIEADGLLPAGVAFIGDLPGGESKQAAISVRFTALTQGSFAYGRTDGTVTYDYEDADGNALTETGTFSVNIQSPFSGESREEPDDPNQWWAVMAAVGAAVLLLAGVLLVRAARRRRGA